MKLLSEEFQEFLFLGIEPGVQMLYHWFVFQVKRGQGESHLCYLCL